MSFCRSSALSFSIYEADLARVSGGYGEAGSATLSILGENLRTATGRSYTVKYKTDKTFTILNSAQISKDVLQEVFEKTSRDIFEKTSRDIFEKTRYLLWTPRLIAVNANGNTNFRLEMSGESKGASRDFVGYMTLKVVGYDSSKSDVDDLEEGIRHVRLNRGK